MAPVTAVIVGAGHRGQGYGQYALEHPDLFQIVGVAEPTEVRRQRVVQNHDVPEAHTFESWEAAAAVPKFADVAMITTQDQMHKAPAVAFAKLGYHILLEKPMAVTAADCRAIAEACEANGVMLCVCHVLRYSPVNQRLRQLVADGTIGALKNISHTEPVGYFHFAHSFVRGNWRREDESSFALMAKCVHDVDLIRWWFGGIKCTGVSSFGSLSEFHSKRKPAQAAARCLDCPLQDSCTYSAKRIYMEKGWFASHITDNARDPHEVEKAVREGPYGRCVWQCDNDVADNQVVSFQFEGGETATLSMIAFTEKLCQRETTFYGTEGQLRCYDSSTIEHFDFGTQQRPLLRCLLSDNLTDGPTFVDL
ncbi:uncharacterized protein MONBRDRAFT_32534 [Monosiga brevicollis MX1]|uniref:Gfo/Idh/MocA-like oxidoreductase N-terminal domain-containing protein n=1 Tax=Monosiga brevicollis TaxID=81824 RepID=A9V057_MONBE|nr:uncharacterized protein MONBRDRAFT_32534 [Monosiga brevicollis MX1]EDQ88953.1 predicted protein [Monosiga brevicollis MX1]|eukprot:XP_001746058.1 hypothetical protein [Monosiga brevicollis MX1]